MKAMMKHVFSATLLVVVCGLLMGLMPSAALGVDFGLYKIFFLGATYDEGTDATTFSYEVRAAVNYGFDDWTIELNPECFGPGDVSDASEPYVYAGPDPITGIYGLTFTTPYSPGETRTVWFRMPGNLSTTAVKVDVRYDCTHWTKEIDGPECPGIGCTPAQCDVTPDRDSVCVRANVTFTADATGTPPFTYCWQKEPYTDPCISATSELTIYGVTLDDEGTYRVMVTNECGEDICYVELIVDECPPTGEGKSPGYWKNELARYLGLKGGKLKEPDIAGYAAQYGYTPEEAHAIMLAGEGGTMVEKLHRQLLAAKLSTAAGYLSGVDALLEEGQYMVAHPEEFTEQELEDAKDQFEALHD